jgi:hypothetical protein
MNERTEGMSEGCGVIPIVGTTSDRFNLAKDILLEIIRACGALPINNELQNRLVTNTVSLADALLAELEKEKK